MKILIKKELSLLLSSPVSVFFTISFLIVTGLMIWIFPGSFNILDGGYASLNNFFKLAPIIFIILIPALCMRSFSEEKRNKTIDIFRTYPKSISTLYSSKFIALFIIVLLVLLSSSIYVYTLNIISNPVGNIDIHEIVSCYFGLIFISLVFLSSGLFASSFTKNQVVAFIISVFINFTAYYGFDLLSSLSNDSQIQLTISSLGLSYYADLMQKGVIQIKDLFPIINYTILFSIATIFLLNHKSKKNKKWLLLSITIIIVINIVGYFIPNQRFDFTSDKRYTLTPYTKELLNKIAEDDKIISIKVYLEGELNPGFKRVQNATKDLLTDLHRLSNNKLNFEYINPYSLYDTPKEIYSQMQNMGMRGIVLNEIDREGKTSQKIVYPYAQILSENDTLTINLLKNISGYSAEENLNASIENLEFEFVDALNIIHNPEPKSIAFIEGHNELPRAFVYDAEELLSKYYFVNRGKIGNSISVLNNFKALIIAGPTSRFSESEKYILDQYIMSGGKVLWLIDGTYFSRNDLEKNGQSANIKNDHNLDDLLFNYGLRINPNIIQDLQSTSIYATSGEEGATNYIEQPWYYSLLLLPSVKNTITKDISLIKGSFVSSIDILSNSTDIKRNVLLTSSAHAHIADVPEVITVDLSHITPDNIYFNQSFLPVAVSLEGHFKSAFKNRMIPDSINTSKETFKAVSEKTKMIVISASDIIRNDIVGHEDQTQVLPMGYDRVSEKQYGNREFIVNAVNWLTSENELLSIRSKSQQIRLLNKQLIYEKRNVYASLNIISPIIFCLLVFGAYYIYRKRKYEKKI